jgi:hypothetical protein
VYFCYGNAEMKKLAHFDKSITLITFQI